MSRFLLLTALNFFALTNLFAQKIKLDFENSFGYSYRPATIKFSTTKPLDIHKLPRKLSDNVVFGEIIITENNNPKKLAVVLDNNPKKGQMIFVDGNGNGDLTDDFDINWINYEYKENGKTYYENFHGGTTIFVKYGKDVQEFNLKLHKVDPQISRNANEVYYCGNWCYKGTVELNGKTFNAILNDDNFTCDFRGVSNSSGNCGVSLKIDLDNNSAYDSYTEQFDVRQPFKIDGIVYEVQGIRANGQGIRIIKSNKTVADKPKVVPSYGKKLEIGDIPYAFEAQTIDGKQIKFPEDFKGKIVLLDFWATWCGPCLAELPYLRQAYERNKDKNFEIVSVSLDKADMAKKLPTYVLDNKMPWIHIAEGATWQSVIANQYSVRSIPFSVLYNGVSGEVTNLGQDLRGSKLYEAIDEAIKLKGEFKKR